MEELVSRWVLKKLYPDIRHKSDALVEGKVTHPFGRNTSSPKMTGNKCPHVQQFCCHHLMFSVFIQYSTKKVEGFQ
jgi:hypothetical protein